MRVAILISALLASTPAFSADLGQEFDTPGLNKMIEEEHMHVVAYGNAIGKTLPAVSIKAVLFLTDYEKHGYIIETDNVLGKPFSHATVMDKIFNMQFFDPDNTKIPTQTMIDGDETNAERFCDEEKTFRPCGYHNDVLAKLHKLGSGVLFQGRAGPSQSNFLIATVFMSTRDIGPGVLYYSTTFGSAQQAQLYVDMKLSKTGTELISSLPAYPTINLQDDK